jgi:4-hydroxy-tetrahydrodipicolinate synthase
MAKTSLPRPLRGIVPPMVTPLKDRDTLDLAGLERLVEHILAGGVHGLFLLGTTGEGPSLSYRVRCELIERVCGQVDGRVPVLVGVTDTAFVESVNLAGIAADEGAAAVVLAPPYYFPAGQPELLEYLEHIAVEMPLPVFLYNMPSHTKIKFELSTLQQALALPNVVGLKDSSGDLEYFRQAAEVIRGVPGASLLMGPERLLADAIALGGHGGVCGGANLFPQLFVDVYEAAVHGDAGRTAELQRRVQQVGDSLYTIGKHSSAFIKGVKCALSCLGICDDALAEPFQRFRPPQREQVQRVLRELGVECGSAVGAM